MHCRQEKEDKMHNAAFLPYLFSFLFQTRQAKFNEPSPVSLYYSNRLNIIITF